MTSNKILLFPYLSYDFDLVKKDSSKNRLLNTNSQSAGEIIYIFEELMIKYSSILNKNYLL